MRLNRRGLAHRAIALLLAVAMPLCCCVVNSFAGNGGCCSEAGRRLGPGLPLAADSVLVAYVGLRWIRRSLSVPPGCPLNLQTRARKNATPLNPNELNL